MHLFIQNKLKGMTREERVFKCRFVQFGNNTFVEHYFENLFILIE